MTKAAPKKLKLPKYVFLKHGDWFVRRNFPTDERDKKGNRKYLQFTHRCEPQTEERAAEVAAEIEAEVLTEKEQKEKPPTVDDFVRTFLDVKRNSIARATYENYLSTFEGQIEGTAFGASLLSDVKLMDASKTAALSKPTTVQGFYTHLTNGGASPSAVRRVHDFLSMVFNQAIRWETVTRNPCKGAILPKAETEEVTFFDQGEARRFVQACRRDNKFIILEFALETGMRPGEYVALRWSDVDLENCTVRVRRAVSIGLRGGGYEIKEPKTRGSRRTIQISEQLRERLIIQKILCIDWNGHLRQRISDPLDLDHVNAKTGANYGKRRVRRRVAREDLTRLEKMDLVFPAKNGGPQSRINLNNREFTDVLNDADLDAKKYSLYSLRHSCATLMLAAGVDVRTIAEKLGHVDPTQVWRTYGHVVPSMRSNSVAQLSSVLYRSNG